MFVGALARGEVEGALLRMGNSSRTLDVKSGRVSVSSEYEGFSSEDDVAIVSAYPTDLSALEPDAFDRIARHGYEVADRTLTTYNAKHFKNHILSS
jgi:NTE family protein